MYNQSTDTDISKLMSEGRLVKGWMEMGKGGEHEDTCNSVNNKNNVKKLKVVC